MRRRTESTRDAARPGRKRPAGGRRPKARATAPAAGDGALAELSRANESLAALHVVGARLASARDEAGVFHVLGEELLQLGFHCGVLGPAPEGGPALAWRFTSFDPPLQRALGAALSRPISEIRVHPAEAPLVARCLAEGRVVYTSRGRVAVGEVLGGASRVEIAAVLRVVGLRRMLLAPLRRASGTEGVLVVAAPRLRRSDPGAIAAFAEQASNALERARLFSALERERARLESEVDRRTRELSRAVRALEETGRRKDNFLANVSHELRTPLVTVLGYTELLLAEKLGPLAVRQRAALGVVASNGKRLRGFIEELLALERHELTKGSLVLAPFDVHDVVTQAILALAPRYAERGLRLRARVARATPPVQGDRERILQVLVNLLTNAERYSPEGALVRVAAARVAPGRVEVAVSDRGPGIPAEHLPHIFERLYQVRDGSPRHDGGALGLGLAIVKSIVEAHGGSVTVRSRPGRGTTFRFSLVVEEGAEPAAPRGDGAAAAG
jgi:signal transduction histidine kinase